MNDLFHRFLARIEAIPMWASLLSSLVVLTLAVVSVVRGDWFVAVLSGVLWVAGIPGLILKRQQERSGGTDPN